MLIPEPPSLPASTPESCDSVVSLVERLNQQLHDQFKKEDRPYKLQERYFTQFKWFEEFVNRPNSILVVGSSYGREAVALMWWFGTQHIVGIDNDDNWTKREISSALSRDITGLPLRVQECLDSLGEEGAELQEWYEENLQTHINDNASLQFHLADITNRSTIVGLEGSFELVYTRYTLDKILEDDGEEALNKALINMRKCIKPNNGKMVIVVPTQKPAKSITSYGWPNHFERAEIIIRDEVAASALGYLEWPETAPVGYILESVI